jgi:hypothetical protein
MAEFLSFLMTSTTLTVQKQHAEAVNQEQHAEAANQEQDKKKQIFPSSDEEKEDDLAEKQEEKVC